VWRRTRLSPSRPAGRWLINSPAHARLVEESKPLAAISVDDYDAVLLVGGQGPIYTFWSDDRVHALVTSEERFADDFVGRKIQPFWIEDEARKLGSTNFIVSGRFKPHAVRDGNLITGQQQYSGRAAPRLMVEALGI
jgi:putative intracellular protease/amidase